MFDKGISSFVSQFKDWKLLKLALLLKYFFLLFFNIFLVNRFFVHKIWRLCLITLFYVGDTTPHFTGIVNGYVICTIEWAKYAASIYVDWTPLFRWRTLFIAVMKQLAMLKFIVFCSDVLRTRVLIIFFCAKITEAMNLNRFQIRRYFLNPLSCHHIETSQ